jgi:pantetheine-phosphate adenylyltransferase
VKVTSFDGLTVDFMKSVGSKFLIRGVRGAMDVEYEQSIAWNNRMLYPECETVILPSSSEHLSLSSSVVRELLKAGVLDTQDGRELLSNYVHVEIIPLLLKSSH